MSRPATDVYRSAFNEYTVVRQVGEGGSGIVYEVTDMESRPYALKAVTSQKATARKLKRFQNEIRFCQQTTHKNIVRILDTGRSALGASFYVMELYPCTLQEQLGKLDPLEVLPVFSEILNGAEAAHLQHVTHRDLKPQNILCNPQSNVYVVADFGIASFAEEELYSAVETQQNERLANFQYASPEQRTRGREVTSKADVYALGLLLNQMFTGEIPLGTQFKKIQTVASMFPYLDDIVDQMIRQDPDQRPSIAEVKKQLIGRNQQFVSQQKINQLTKQVVPEGTLTDPLVVDPIRASNFDYRDGHMLVTLSQAPNPQWIQQFQNQSTTSFMGMGPVTTTFRGVIATVPTRKSTVVQQKSYFEGWIRNANGLYEEAVKRAMEVEKNRREKELRRQLSEERERQEILKLLGSS